MMKSKDVSVAVALIIGGYLRANVGEDGKNENQHLADCLAAARQEIDDWSENIASDNAAISHDAAPSGLTVDIRFGASPVRRTPYNLISAAHALVLEAVDLSGPHAVEDLRARLAI